MQNNMSESRNAEAHLVRLLGRSADDDRYVCSRCGRETDGDRETGIHLCHGCGCLIDTDDVQHGNASQALALKNLDAARKAADRETSVVTYSGGYNGSLCDEHDVQKNRGWNIAYGSHRGSCTMCQDEYQALLRAPRHDDA